MCPRPIRWTSAPSCNEPNGQIAHPPLGVLEAAVGAVQTAPMVISPAAPDLLAHLESASPDELDQLSFGVIGFAPDERVTVYNAYEADAAGLDPARIIGRDLFVEVAPCANNYLVAERYRECDTLDEELDYVFTLRMRPTPVRLRLLADPGAEHRYMVVVRSN